MYCAPCWIREEELQHIPQNEYPPCAFDSEIEQATEHSTVAFSKKRVAHHALHWWLIINLGTRQWLHKWLDEVLGMENCVALTLSQRRTSDVFSLVAS